MGELSRVTVSISEDLLEKLDALVDRHGHTNRSEIIRDLIRDRLVETYGSEDRVVGSLTVLYDHRQRALSETLTGMAHDHHGLVLSTLHVHLDHDHCLEVSVLKGTRGELSHYAEHVLATKGVLHGRLVLTGGVG
jgi:CopG family nickel-responsive transcriptional regulator